MESSPDSNTLYRRDVRATMPKPQERLDAALSTQFTRTDRQALDLLAAWPFCTPDQRSGLMGGVIRRRANQVLRSLRLPSLAQPEPDGYVLTDDDLTYLARRDRAAVGPTPYRWTPQWADSGDFAGSALRVLASEADHQRGTTEFASQLTAEVARNPDYELLHLLPTHRTQTGTAAAATSSTPGPRSSSDTRATGTGACWSTSAAPSHRSGYPSGCAGTGATS